MRKSKTFLGLAGEIQYTLRLKIRKPLWFPTSHIAMNKITHDLRISLLIPNTRTDLMSIRTRLMSDPAARYIPTEAFMWPNMMSIHVGHLSLPSEQGLSAAKAHLQNLDLNQILYKLRTVTGDSRLSNKTKAGRPIKISALGLEQFKDPSRIYNAPCIRVPVHCEEGVLTEFLRSLVVSFTEAGLMPRLHTIIDPRLRFKIVDCQRLDSTVNEEKPSLIKLLPKGESLKRMLQFNAEEIFQKYQDSVWFDNFNLEMLAIYELGLYDFKRGEITVGRGNREVASAPLPGASHLDWQEDLSDIVLEKTPTEVGNWVNRLLC